LTPRHNAQSGAYFEQAVEALRSAGDPHVLWGEAPDWHKGGILEPFQRRADAIQRRGWLLRSAVLFAALSAEAYANEILIELLTPADADALDRLPTTEKLLLGPKIAGSESPLDRGKEPFQTVQRLFKVRATLVHPRATSPAAFPRYITDNDEKLIGPRAAGKDIIAVAGVTELLDPLRPPPPNWFRPGQLVAKHPEILDKHLTDIGDTILFLPAEDSPRPVSLLTLASRREKAKRASAAPKQ